MLFLSARFEQPGAHVLNKFGQGIHKFLSSNNTFLYMSVQDPCTPPSSSYNEEKNVSIWNSGGRRKVIQYLPFNISSSLIQHSCIGL